MSNYKQKAIQIIDGIDFSRPGSAFKVLENAISSALSQAVEAERGRIEAIIGKELYFIPEGDLKRVQKAIRSGGRK